MSIYSRSIGISLLKSIAYMIALSAGMLFVAERISPVLFLVALYVLYFFLTFFFSEWIFEDVTVRTKQLVIIILVTFLLETILSVGFFRYMGLTTFNFQVLYRSLIFLVLHAGGMVAALTVRRRAWAREGLSEGLES